MAYAEYHPHSALAPYIDAYWKVTGDNMPLATQTILPDGCVDIIMNLGDDEVPDADGFFMKNERTYLVGTMSRAIEFCCIIQQTSYGTTTQRPHARRRRSSGARRTGVWRLLFPVC